MLAIRGKGFKASLSPFTNLMWPYAFVRVISDTKMVLYRFVGFMQYSALSMKGSGA